MSTQASLAAAHAGELLREHRRRAGLTQATLAARTGLGLRTLRELERGRVRRPHDHSIVTIAEALQLSSAEISGLRAAFATVGTGRRAGVGVLGPLIVTRGPNEIDIGPPIRRQLLGLLALQPNRVVSRDEIVDVLWADRPPRTWLRLVHSHIAALRTLLDPHRVRRSPRQAISLAAGGYRLDPAAVEVDLARFDQLTAHAQRAHRVGSLLDALAGLEQALDCWRGPVLSGADPRLQQHPLAVAAWRRRVAATLTYVDLAMALGHPELAVAPLQELVPLEPLHEALHARLVLALAGTGEHAIALSQFAKYRDKLRDELGTDPGPEMRDAHLRILRDEVAAPSRAAPAHEIDPHHAGPVQLPAAVPDFVGRADHLAALDDLLSHDGCAPVVISAIAGIAGVGKTELALQWGHRVARHFPDGLLYVDLRGYSAGSPMRPIDALGRLLRGLGVAGARIPVEPDEAATLLRSTLAGKRVLLVLDNARSPEQVRLLLPGTPGCRVVITSRDLLAGLIATHGTQRLRLDILADDDAVALLSRLIGDTQAAAEPRPVRDLVKLCGHLPLAIRIVGANLAARGDRKVEEYGAELSRGDLLDALVVDGDPGHAVRAALGLSYRTLSAADQRMFRLFGLVPGSDLTAAAAAALADTTIDQAERQLAALVTASLVQQSPAGRYSMHDLLRRYATELTTIDGPTEADAATGRLLNWYVSHAYQAAVLVTPHQPRLPDADSDVRGPAAFADNTEALAWLDSERASLLAAVDHAAASRRPAAWLLTDALRGYLWSRQHHIDLVHAAASALPAAEAGGDLRAQAAVRQALGQAYYSQGDLHRATEEHRRALELGRASGWPHAEASALANLGLMAWEAGRLSQAAEYFNEGLAVERREGMHNREARTLVSLGHVAARAGRLGDAHASYTRSLNVTNRRPSPDDQLLAHNCLGFVLHALGRLDESSHHLLTGLDLATQFGNAYSASTILECLATVYRDAGRHDEAAECARASLALAENLREKRLRAEPLNTLATIVGSTAAETAGRLHAEALALAESAGDQYTIALILTDHANLIARDDPTAARRHARRACEVAKRGEFRVIEGDSLTALARAELSLGAGKKAAVHSRAAAAIQQKTGHRLGEARALLALADALDWASNVDSATAARRRAEELRTQLGNPDPVGDRATRWLRQR